MPGNKLASSEPFNPRTHSSFFPRPWKRPGRSRTNSSVIWSLRLSPRRTLCTDFQGLPSRLHRARGGEWKRLVAARTAEASKGIWRAALAHSVSCQLKPPRNSQEQPLHSWAPMATLPVATAAISTRAVVSTRAASTTSRQLACPSSAPLRRGLRFRVAARPSAKPLRADLVTSTTSFWRDAIAPNAPGDDHGHHRRAEASFPTSQGSSALPADPVSKPEELGAIPPGEDVFPDESEPLWSWRGKMLGTMLKFLGPALFLPLADPLMSVVDTVAIGQYCSTTQLASLGPVTLIFSFTNYMWNSQGIATTSLVAGALNKAGKTKKDAHAEAGKVMASSMLLAVCAGVIACIFLQMFAPNLLKMTGAAPELIAPGLEYLRVRALATPASFLINVSQASLMGQRQSLLPCLVIAAAAATNFVLDMTLVVSCGMGVGGAAWATLASQYMAAAIFIFILHKHSKVRPVWHIPSSGQLQKFASSVGPLAFIYFCKNICYASIQRMATALPVLQLAAHQPIFMMWNLCAFSTAPIEQAALAFLPAAKTRRQREEVPKLIMAIGMTFAMMAGIISSGTAVFLPQLFSPDVRLYAFMSQMAGLGFAAMMACGLEVSANSILVCNKEYKFIASAMLRTLLATAAYIAVMNSLDLGLTGVWSSLIVFYGSRMCQSVPKMLHLVRAQIASHPGEGGDKGSLLLKLA